MQPEQRDVTALPREGRDSLFDHVDPLQRRADEIARADLAEDVNLDLQRVYSGLMTVEEFEDMYA